jgi:hypothetical protein
VNSVRCPVLGSDVIRVTDLEGNTTRIICPEYDGSNGTCRLKGSAFDGGPLARLLERVSQNGRGTRATLCLFRRGDGPLTVWR